MNYEQLFYENEEKYRKVNEEIFRVFIKSYKRKCSINTRKIIENLEEQGKDYCGIFWAAYSDQINHPSRDMTLFFEQIKRFKFCRNDFLISSIRLLGYRCDNGIPDNVHNKMLNSPLINEIEYKDKMLYVYSQIGDFHFYPIKEYFDYPHPLWIILSTNNYTNKCHKGSWEIIPKLEEANLETWLIPYYFTGTMYHSVVEDREGNVVDVANSSVYDRDTFSRIFNGTLVCRTKKEELYEKLRETNCPIPYYEPLVLALHKQGEQLRK